MRKTEWVPPKVPKIQPWIGVDFDRTLARYEKWSSVLNLGEPLYPMVNRVKGWIAEGKKVKIFTARISPPFDPAHVTPADVIFVIQNWCELHLGARLEVTATKDIGMYELWDDRAVEVIPNVGEPRIPR
jgi:hypothetical protein